MGWVWGSSLVALTRVMQVALRLVRAASPKHIWHKQVIHNLGSHLCQGTDFLHLNYVLALQDNSQVPYAFVKAILESSYRTPPDPVQVLYTV